MRAVIQKVKKAKVEIDNKLVSEIDKGFLVFVAVTDSDQVKDIDYITKKIEKLRVFYDDDGKMNLSLDKVGGEILVVSQFTLYGDVRKGNRPSFIRSSNGDKAKAYYDLVIQRLKDDGFCVKTGEFGADMQVSLINDGPCTIQLDSERIY
ncbi:MAG: D-aminoacyl-tRNA deacylase [Tissierellia bacterium]|nr:D-aminoacyl-tRNA deacylase [Tissierellia bacterium]